MSEELPSGVREKEGGSDERSTGEGVKGGEVTGEGVKSGEVTGEGVKGGEVTGEGVKSGEVTGEGVTDESTDSHSITDNKTTHKDTSSKLTQKGAAQYQLVFMEQLSSESGLTDSLSPRNHESSSSFLPEPVPAQLNSSEGHPEIDESCSTVSSSTLKAESTSCDVTDGAEERGEEGGGGGREGRGEGGEREGGVVRGGEGEEGAGGGEQEGNYGVFTKHELNTQERGDAVVNDETRSQSTTPSPKPKEHALSRYTSDSDVAVSPSFTPVEYHSSEEESRNHTPSLPLLTPSPLPPGADSPDHPAMSILFSGVFYLGSSTVDAPISETEANRKMNILHEQALTSHPMPIILSVPITNNGSVLLKDPKTDQPLTTFPIKMILFCARGNGNLQDCFCLNVRHKRSGTYHCHVFRCEIMEAVSLVTSSFEESCTCHVMSVVVCLNATQRSQFFFKK